MIGGRQTYLYFEGTPLFPFGHGLAYTTFAYEDLSVTEAQAALKVSFTVTNTGEAPHGRGRPALRARRGPVGAAPPPRTAGPPAPPPHSRRLGSPDLRTPLSALEFWDVAVGRTRLEPGAYELLAGASSEDIRLRTTITLTGEPATPARYANRA